MDIVDRNQIDLSDSSFPNKDKLENQQTWSYQFQWDTQHNCRDFFQVRGWVIQMYHWHTCRKREHQLSRMIAQFLVDSSHLNNENKRRYGI